MSEIEELTDEERSNLTHGIAATLGQTKALRIIEQQAGRIGDLEALLAHLQEDLSKNLFIRDETRAKQGKRITELEAQVLASETVSKVEYAAMVKQRDTMREDLKAARHLLNDALDWLEAQAEGVDGGLIEQIRALPPFRA